MGQAQASRASAPPRFNSCPLASVIDFATPTQHTARSLARPRNVAVGEGSSLEWNPLAPPGGTLLKVTRTNRDQRDAQLAAVLADAVRAGLLQAADALRVIRHEMRRRNTNKKATLPYRSARAQAVINEYAERGASPPKNGSDDALHADHVYEFGADQLFETVTVDDWHQVLTAARTVVVVTARENYALEKLENTGLQGPSKYAAAGVTWAGEAPAFVGGEAPADAVE